MFKLKRQKEDGVDICICEEGDRTLMLRCDNESCLNPWWHTECAGLKGITAAVIKKLSWFCPCCSVLKLSSKFEPETSKDTVIDTDYLKAEIKQGIADCLPAMVNDLMTKVQPNPETIKQNMKKSFAEIMKEQSEESPALITKTTIKEAITEGKREQDELEKRKRNIMIFNAKEAVSDDANQAKAEDLKLIKEVCHYVDGTILENENEIVSVIRLGRKDRSKMRAMKVTVKTEKAKRKLFGNLYKLKDNDKFKTLSFNHDMTDVEKQNTKEKVKEAKQKTNDLQNNTALNEDAKNWVFLVRGPPWDQKIRKIRPRQQTRR